jgi:TRAP transporter TAXI family solute receptor
MQMLRTTLLRKYVAWGMIAILIASLLTWYITWDRLPARIRIATAQRDGQYFQFGEGLAEALEARTSSKVTVLPTDGSIDNHARLRSGEAELAIVQSGAVSLRGLAVVAPLYREVVHIIVRKDRGIQKIRDLKGRNVAVGPEGSGYRKSARNILENYGLALDDLNENTRSVGELLADPTIDAAIVTTGMKNPSVHGVLSSGDFDILPLHAKAMAAEYAHFDQVAIPQGYYATDPAVPSTDTQTVAATALLVCREDAPSITVSQTLDALYEEDLADTFPNLIPHDDAIAMTSRRLHPAARRHFDPFDHVGRLATVIEGLAGARELLFACVAGIYLLWDRWRRLKEKERRILMQTEKDRLDQFLASTLKVERAQMDETDPARLNQFLDEITNIKLKALEQLTDETLRGDRVFAIFLMQCANLIGKIQSKILIQSSRVRTESDAASD